MKIIINLILIHIVQSINATECEDMYKNNTIKTKCLNSTSCCIVNYFYNNNYTTNCIIKNNQTEDLCNEINDRISLFSGEVEECDCYNFFININIFIIILTITLI